VGLDEVRSTWEEIGRDDPFWAVLSWPGRERGAWDLEEFFAQGEREVAAFLDEVSVVGLPLRFGSVLDFGCGVGRLSRALATRFERVHGIDISAPMIEQARRLVGAQHANCEFTVSSERTLPFAPGTFDALMSNIVLQHMPSKLARSYISEFVRVLKPGGVAIFQVPARQIGGSRSANPLVRGAMNALPSQWREEIMRRRAKPDARNLPMHGTPRAKVVRTVERRGARVAACIEDRAAGANWRSFHYLVTRP